MQASQNKLKANVLDDLFSGRLHWAPEYYYKKIDDSVILLSEKDSLILKGNHYIKLFDLLITIHDARKSKAHIEDNKKVTSENLACILYAAEKCLAQGYLIYLNKKNSSYDTVDIDDNDDNDFLPIKNSSSIIWLSKLIRDDVLQSLLEKIHDQLANDSYIVVLDDWLDPRLRWIEQHCQALSSQKETVHVLVIRISGQQPCIGPLLQYRSNTNMQKDAPCHLSHCVSRFLHNKPVINWLLTLLNETHGYIPVPVYYSQALAIEFLAHCLEKFDLEKSNITTGAMHQKLMIYDANKKATERHPILPYVDNEHGHAIALRSIPCTFNEEGGYRICSAEKTLAKLKPLISPVTGIITHLKAVETIDTLAKNLSIKVYQAGFFKHPVQNHVPDQDGVHQLALGKGINAIQSQVSALCEAIERYCAQYNVQQETIAYETALPENLSKPYYLPQALAPFSEKQYIEFEKKYCRQSVKPYANQRPLKWVSAWSLKEQCITYIPHSYCYHQPHTYDAQYCRWNSNGCAAGNNLEEAILQGMLEVIERDAVAIWWYNRLLCPGIDKASLPKEQCKVIDEFLLPEWHYHLINITQDIAVPTVAAIAQHRKNGEIRMGFGCHVSSVLACQRAMTELCQIIAIGENGQKDFNFKSIKMEPYLQANAVAGDRVKIDHTFDMQSAESLTLDKVIQHCVGLLAEKNLDTLVYRYGHTDIPLRVVKVIVPGACHIWPQLAVERLYQVPKSMGYEVKNLNPINLYL